MSPLRVCPLRVVSLPYVCFFVWLFLHMYVTSVYMSLRMHVPSVCISTLHVYIPFVCLSLRMYVPLYDCCWNSNSSNDGLVRQVSGVHKPRFVPTLNRLLAYSDSTLWNRYIVIVKLVMMMKVLLRAGRGWPMTKAATNERLCL